MRKICLRKDQTVSASIALDPVSHAQEMARELVLREARGPGDLDNAMRRIETRYGIGYSALWALRYRPPKDIGMRLFGRLKAAWEAERQRQLRQLEHDRWKAEQIAGPAAHFVAAARAALDEADDETPAEVTRGSGA